MRITRRGLLAGAAASAGACVSAPTIGSPDAAARADAIAARLHANFPTPALSLAVARTSGVVWAKCHGKANLEFDIKATPQHAFKLGSVSKIITATAAARMAMRGALDLDAPISRWMTDLPEQHRATTLRQLLTHRGGVRHYQPRDFSESQPGGNIDRRVYPTSAAMLAVFINDPLIAEPGTTSTYSTFGYTLASIAMEAATAKPFLQLIADEIATPYALPTLAADDPVSLRPNRAAGYGRASAYANAFPLAAGDWVNIRQVNPAYKWAGGGLLCTPSDLARFGAAHFDPAFTPPALRDILFAVQVEPTPNSPPLGLGWRVDADGKGRKRWHHAGNQDGGRSGLVVYPDLAVAVAISSNVSSIPGDVLTPASALADVFG